jgi:hypothetical protein
MLIAVSSFGESLRQVLLTALAEAAFNSPRGVKRLQRAATWLDFHAAPQARARDPQLARRP